MERKQRHHILFNRRIWIATPELQALRNHPSLITPLDEVTHRDLHREVSSIPPPDFHMARRMAREYEPARDPIVSIGHLCMAIETAMQHPKSRFLERELGSLIICNLEAQIPFIREGMYDRVS